MRITTRCGVGSFVLLAVVASVVRADETEEEAVKAIKAAGGIATGVSEKGREVISIVSLTGPKFNDEIVPHLKAIKGLKSLYMGDSKTTGKGIKDFPNLETLDLSGSAVTDDELKNIATLPGLETLLLSNTKITDTGIEKLQTCKKLRFLFLDKTEITDRGLRAIKGFNELAFLNLGNAAITDAGLRELHGMSKLQQIRLKGATGITEGGISELRKALPRVEVIREK
jgi:hypothetical protein